MSEFQLELSAYRAKLPAMLSGHEGDYVVIKGADPVHYSPSYEAALNWAYDKFGLQDFFVKKVAQDQDVAHYARDLGPCRT